MPRKQKKYHYIYKTTCTITGKFYVGMHSTDNLDDGYLGSGKILGYSRRKYGDENHVREILEYLPSRQSLKEREKEIVNEELLTNPLNINLKYGGEGGWDHIRNQSQAGKIGMASFLERVKQDKVFAAYISKIRSDKLKQTHADGKIRYNTFSGKQHSKTTKEKISKACSLSQKGKKNSQFGTCWVTKDSKPIKIKKEQLDEYLANGYSRGRK